MMNRYGSMTLAFLITGLVITFQNCSKVAISDKGSNSSNSALSGGGNGGSGGGSGGPSTSGPTGDPNVDNLITSCADAKSRGKISTKKVSLTFENPGKVCDWESNGNLSIKDKFVRARVEQYMPIDVPAGATVCQVRLENTDVQNFLYDDNIILTMNDYILASTTDFSANFDSKNGYYKYDWTKLINKDAQNDKGDTTLDKQYCPGRSVGLSTCAFPITETVGSVSLQFSDRVTQNILGLTSSSNIRMGMITTGDNDSTDCQHVPINFKVDVDYF